MIRIVGNFTIVFFFFFYVGAQFLGGGKTLENLFGINRTVGMIIVVLLVVPYTIYGGFRSVTYTDVIQAIVMIITLIVAPIAGIIYKIVGYVWAGIGSTFSVVIMLTLFWKKYHGRAVIATIISGLIFTIVWIQTGMDEIVSARLVIFIVAIMVAVGGTYFLSTKQN